MALPVLGFRRGCVDAVRPCWAVRAPLHASRVAGAACTGDSDATPDPATSPTQHADADPEKPRNARRSASAGTEEEVAAYQRVVDSYNATTDHRQGRAGLLARPRGGSGRRARGRRPRRLPDLAHRPRPAGRGGGAPADRASCSTSAASTSATATRATPSRPSPSTDDLQCMPYGVSPMVIYYNTDLVDFERMERRGLDVPDGRPRRQPRALDARGVLRRRRVRHPSAATARGVYIAPTLAGLAPFIYSGGGKVFDDDDEPTSLAFSDDDTREALERDARRSCATPRSRPPTPSSRAPRRSSWFKRGKLAMIAGYRNARPRAPRRRGPRLRRACRCRPSTSPATVGDITGLCISADSERPGRRRRLHRLRHLGRGRRAR